jgi:hypothetical protein
LSGAVFSIQSSIEKEKKKAFKCSFDFIGRQRELAISTERQVRVATFKQKKKELAISSFA